MVWMVLRYDRAGQMGSGGYCNWAGGYWVEHSGSHYLVHSYLLHVQLKAGAARQATVFYRGIGPTKHT